MNPTSQNDRSSKTLTFRVSCRAVLFFTSCLVFRATLDVAYVVFVSPVFLYLGFDLELSGWKYLSSWLLFILPLTFCSSTLVRPSQYIIVFAVLGLVAPLTSFYGLTDRGVYPVLVTCSSIMLLAMVSSARWFKVPALPTVAHGEIVAVTLAVVAVAYLIVWYVISGAVNNFNLNLLKVYEYRSATARLTSFGLLAYINTWAYSICSVFLFSLALYRRRYMLAGIVFLIQVLFFAVSGHKSLVFYPLLVIGVWFYFKRTQSMTVVPCLFTAVVAAALILYLLIDDILLGSLLIRRVFFVPAALTYDYFSFFSNESYVVWSNSVLKSVFSYPYPAGVAELIGEYNGSGANANNGYISSGYAHFGLVGVLMYTLLFGVVLRYLDVTTAGRVPVWLVLAIVVVPIRSAIVSSDLLTVLLTHGLLVGLLLIALIRGPRRGEVVV